MEAESESELESEESSDLIWIDATEAETEALLSCYKIKMAEGRHVFHSKSQEKGLSMSCMIGWFFCLQLRFPSATWSQATESEVELEEKEKRSDACYFNFVKLRIVILLAFFLIHTGTEGSLCFQFRRQFEPALKKVWYWGGNEFLVLSMELIS